MKISLEGLTESFKQEIMKDKTELEKIEKRIEERYEKRSQYVRRSSFNRR
jgi:hypothetical protein